MGVRFYLIAYLDAGIKVYGSSSARRTCEFERDKRIARTPKHVCPQFYIVGEDEYTKLLAEDNKRRQARKDANQKRGAEKRAKRVAERKTRGTQPHFILCPTCNGKSRKIRSEMGGLQTRVCKKGHYFEVDTFFGFETNKRRIEQVDRPFFCPTGGNYNDWVYGKYKDDPMGKRDMLEDILRRDRESR